LWRSNCLYSTFGGCRTQVFIPGLAADQCPPGTHPLFQPP
jgi:hypothetical protein